MADNDGLTEEELYVDAGEDIGPDDMDVVDISSTTTTLATDLGLNTNGAADGAGAIGPYSNSVDYDEHIPDLIVDMVVNGQPQSLGGTTASFTDEFNVAGGGMGIGTDMSSSSSSSTFFDEISSTLINDFKNDTTTLGGKQGRRWWGPGWTTEKIILVTFISLCALGILLGILYLILGKSLKKRSAAGGKTPAATTPTATTGKLAKQYQPVPAKENV